MERKAKERKGRGRKGKDGEGWGRRGKEGEGREGKQSK